MRSFQALKEHPFAKPEVPRLYFVREAIMKRLYIVVAYTNDHALALAQHEFEDFVSANVRIVELEKGVNGPCEVAEIFYADHEVAG